ncbi:MAG TPA: ESPR-type extended signal peptide-containing protein [Pinirhizobacter sp.]|jgi:autotransporter adhesin
MNTIYRIVWNVTLGKWVVASELAKGRKKKSSLKTAMLSLAVIGAMAGIGAPSVYAADITMPSCVAGEDPHETGCMPTSSEQLMTPFYVAGDADDKGNATNTAIGQGAVAGTTSTTNTYATAVGAGAKATATSATAIGRDSVASGTYSFALGWKAAASGDSTTAMGVNAQATQRYAVAIGNDSEAFATDSVAIGSGSGVAAAGASGIALGNDAQVNGLNGTALGKAAMADSANSVAIGSNAKSMGQHGIAMGSGAVANKAINSNGNGAVAIGNGSYADASSLNGANPNGSVAVGSNTAAYASGSVAIGDGAKASVSSVTGGAGSDANFGVSVGMTSISGNGGAAVGYQSNASGNSATAMGIRATAAAANAVAVGNSAKVDSAATGGLALGASSSVSATATNSVALGAGSSATQANTVSVGTSAITRKVVNMTAGVAPTDAVNVSQLTPVVDALGGGASIDSTTGAITGPTYVVGGNTYTNVGDALGNVDGRVTINEGGIVDLGTRVTKNEGDITTIDGRVTKNEGDITNLQNNVSTATRYFKAEGLNNGSDDAVASGSRAVAMGASSDATSAHSIAIGFGAQANTNEGTVAIGANSRASGENSVALGSDSIADRDNVVSVGMGPSIGNGTRQIINVTNGTENTDAVNVQQLKPAIAALGGGATFNANGTITGPQYTVADLDNGGNKAVNNVGDALGQLNANTTSLDGRVTTNEGDIIDLGDRINNGSVGLVQQSGANAIVTVAGAAGGTVVDFTGTEGTRQLKGVSEGSDGTDAVNVSQLRNEIANASAGDTRYFKADGANDGSDDAVSTGSRSVAIGAGSQAVADNAVALGAGSVADRANAVSVGSKGSERQIINVAAGTDDTDAVNVGQLKAAGLVGGDGSTLDAVVYDAGSNRGSVTFGGLGGTKLTNVMAGLVSSTSTDAINGSQLWILQDQVNNIGDRVTNIENNGAPGNDPVTPLPAPGTGEGGRDPAFAANGDGGPASATGKDSVAVGTGASASADNSVAIGAGSVADRADTVSVGSVGNERQISNVAAGTQRTDAANWGQVQDALATANRYTDDRFDSVNRRIGEVQRQANKGIAASAALINVTPYMPGKTVLNAGVANYRGESALGVGVSRWNDSGRVNFNAGMSAAAGDTPIFRVGMGVVLGD